MPTVPAGTGSPLSGSTMRTSMPGNGLPQLPQAAARHVGVGGVAAVRPESLCHAEQRGPRPGLRPLLGRQQGFQTPRAQRGEIGTDLSACRASVSA